MNTNRDRDTNLTMPSSSKSKKIKRRLYKKSSGVKWRPRYGAVLLQMNEDSYKRFTDLLLKCDVYPQVAPTFLALIAQKLIVENIAPSSLHPAFFLGMAIMLIKAAEENAAMHDVNINPEVEGNDDIFSKLKEGFAAAGFVYSEAPGFYGLEKMRYDDNIN